MNLTSKYLLWILICGTLSFSCKKSATVINAGFSCKLNGTQWSPHSDDFKNPSIQATFNNSNKSLLLLGINTNTREHIGIGLYTENGITDGIYTLDKNTAQGFYNQNATGKQFTSENMGGTCSIQIDKPNRTISGTFSFKAIDPSTKQTVDVTGGTFNVKYLTY